MAGINISLIAGKGLLCKEPLSYLFNFYTLPGSAFSFSEELLQKEQSHR